MPLPSSACAPAPSACKRPICRRWPNGGMQPRRLWPCREPYNADYLTAPFASAPPAGAGTATATSFAAFGLAERDLVEQPWPCVQQRPVCLPVLGVIFGARHLAPDPDHGRRHCLCPHHGRLLEVLDVVVADDAETRGDLWRMQPGSKLPKPPEVRLPIWNWLPGRCPQGKRLGVPRMFINRMNWRAPATIRHRRPDQSAHPHPSVRDCPLGRGPQGAGSRGRRGHRSGLPAGLQLRGDRPGAPTVFNQLS